VLVFFRGGVWEFSDSESVRFAMGGLIHPARQSIRLFDLRGDEGVALTEVNRVANAGPRDRDGIAVAISRRVGRVM
jgi:hypothetical protein